MAEGNAQIIIEILVMTTVTLTAERKDKEEERKEAC